MAEIRARIGVWRFRFLVFLRKVHCCGCNGWDGCSTMKNLQRFSQNTSNLPEPVIYLDTEGVRRARIYNTRGLKATCG